MRRYPDRVTLSMPDRPAPTDNRAALIAALSDVLDEHALRRLAELDPDDRGGLLRRVLLTYEQSLRRLAGQFEQARLDSDAQGLRQVAHTLKSSSASVGALALARHCADVERGLRDGAEPAALQADLDALGQQSRIVLAALQPLAGSA
jgi:HPt (histidine-containing phosphotransfer) domain-containing protein